MNGNVQYSYTTEGKISFFYFSAEKILRALCILRGKKIWSINYTPSHLSNQLNASCCIFLSNL